MTAMDLLSIAEDFGVINASIKYPIGTHPELCGYGYYQDNTGRAVTLVSFLAKRLGIAIVEKKITQQYFACGR
ncbi:MAG: hypothetical protein RL736_916 [Pseudomonadota bacterium]